VFRPGDVAEDVSREDGASRVRLGIAADKPCNGPMPARRPPIIVVD